MSYLSNNVQSAAKYKYFGKQLSHSNAAASCRAKGGKLAQPTSQAEQDEIIAVLKKHGGPGWVWLGIMVCYTFL